MFHQYLFKLNHLKNLKFIILLIIFIILIYYFQVHLNLIQILLDMVIKILNLKYQQIIKILLLLKHKLTIPIHIILLPYVQFINQISAQN